MTEYHFWDLLQYHLKIGMTPSDSSALALKVLIHRERYKNFRFS